jgi:protein involved in polysaccharide export with SLBB domain
VRLPSVYSLRPETSVAQAIALAGGPTLDARVDRVRLIRTGGEILVDLRQASAGATRTTIRSGDRIVIERNRAIFRDIVTPAIMILGATAAVASVILYNRHP